VAKKRVKIDHLLFFLPRCSWNYFAMFSTTRDQTATWQCCCGIGGFSATTQPWLRVQTHRKGRNGQTGVWVASSHGLLFGGSDRGFVCRKFCECILAEANDVCRDGFTLLNTEEINMLVVLRMNREFIQHMCKI